MSTISPNMNLVLSTIGVDSGLNWETNLNASLTSVDSHNHSSGQGIQIQPNGLNINSNLTFQTNQATNVGAVLFTNQSSLATLNALYVINGDLWYNDATSAIQLTLGGAVNATSSGIVSGSASAAFSGGVLIVDSASNTPANVQCGSVLLGNNVAASNFLTLAPPSSMASSFTVTLPSIPGSQSFLTIDTSGNIGAYASIAGGITGVNIAAGTIAGSNIASATIQGSNIAASTIAGSNIAASTIAGSNIAPTTIGAGNIQSYAITSLQQTANIVYSGNNAVSANSSSFVLAGAVSITTNGGPVRLEMIPTNGTIGTASGFTTSGGGPILEILLERGGGGIASIYIGSGAAATSYFPPSCANMIDYPVAGSPGTYTYSLYIRVVSGSGTVTANNLILTASEIA